MRRGHRITITGAVAVGSLVGLAAPAVACGALLGADGTIELGRTTTLSAYTDGVQRYVTGFEFTGQGEEVGSIVPLPDVPSDVERGGDWTLQRLVQEVAPPAREAFALEAADEGESAAAEVLLETEVDALDLTVLRGGAGEVGRWASDNGFFLSPDAPEMLDFYAQRSEIFLAAKFDASRADDLGQQVGSSTPIMLTIPTDRPWVPLRILSLGADDSQVVEADVFLLTDDEPQLLAGGDGLELDRSEPASRDLLDDLRSDEGMGWLPQQMWLTYLRLDTPAGELDYDLAASVDPGARPTLADAGVLTAASGPPVVPGEADRWPWVLGLAGGVLVLGAALRSRWGRHRDPA